MKAKLKCGDLLFLYELQDKLFKKTILQVGGVTYADEVKYGVFFVSDPEIGYILKESDLNKLLNDASIHVIGERTDIELVNLFEMGLHEQFTQENGYSKKQIKDIEKTISHLKELY